jgi:vacuolar-type H+-ATPase subunit H
MDSTSRTTGSPGAGGTAQDQSVIDKAKETASGVVSQAKEAAAGVVGQAQETVQPQIESQKEKAVSQLGGLADAVRQTSQQLHSKDQHGLANVVEQSAERVDKLAGYLRVRDFNQLVGDVERYSRREPALFVGGALALGFIAARFLKSSRERAYENEASDYYSPSYRPSSYSAPYTPPGSSSLGNSGVWSARNDEQVNA